LPFFFGVDLLALAGRATWIIFFLISGSNWDSDDIESPRMRFFDEDFGFIGDFTADLGVEGAGETRRGGSSSSNAMRSS
jgi:hypothetical protein